MADPKWPFGPATSSTIAAAATVGVTIENDKTILNFGTLAAAMALTLTPHAELNAGAEVIIKAKSDGTARDITLTGALPATLAGAINKTMVQTFIYDGTSFIAKGAKQQLD